MGQGGMMDPTMMIKMMFGGDLFDDLIGELSLIAMMSMTEEEMAGKTEEDVMIMMEAKEIEKVAKIEVEIMKKIELYLQDKDKSIIFATTFILFPPITIAFRTLLLLFLVTSY
jgi:hypothetical protein